MAVVSDLIKCWGVSSLARIMQSLPPARAESFMGGLCFFFACNLLFN